MECLLKDKEYDRIWWEPLRRGQKPVRVPVQVESQVGKEGGKSIRFFFEEKPPTAQGEIANV